MMPSKARFAGAALAAGSLFAAGEAHASGYLTARFGADHGTPAMPNTYAVYFNPAALGGTTGTTITGDLSIALRWASYERSQEALSPSDPNLKNDPSYVSTNTGKANLLNLLALPFAGINTDFGGSRYFRGGYAIYVPFGGFATWDRTDPTGFTPGSYDRVQRWHNISGQLLAIYNTFAFAVKPHERFSIGVSLSPVIHTVKTVRARNADGSDDTVVNGELKEGRSLLKAHGLNFQASVGVYWEPTDDLHLGLSYASQPGFGQTKMSGELTTQLGASKPGTTDVDFYQSYPDIVRLGVVGRPAPKWDIRADFEYVRWSVFDKQCVVAAGRECDVDESGRAPDTSGVILNVPRNWKDAIGFRAGPSTMLTDDLEVFGSLGVTTPAVPRQTIDASTIDAFRLYMTAGGRLSVSKHLALGASYNHIHFFTVNTEGRSQQNIPDHPASAPDGRFYNASRSPSADGTYRSQLGFVNLNAAYTF